MHASSQIQAFKNTLKGQALGQALPRQDASLISGNESNEFDSSYHSSEQVQDDVPQRILGRFSNQPTILRKKTREFQNPNKKCSKRDRENVAPEEVQNERLQKQRKLSDKTLELANIRPLGLFNKGRVSSGVEIKRGPRTSVEQQIASSKVKSKIEGGNTKLKGKDALNEREKHKERKKRRGIEKEGKERVPAENQQPSGDVLDTLNTTEEDVCPQWKGGTYFQSLKQKLLSDMEEAKVKGQKNQNKLQSEHIAMYSKNIVESSFVILENMKDEEAQIGELSLLMNEVDVMVGSLVQKSSLLVATFPPRKENENVSSCEDGQSNDDPLALPIFASFQSTSTSNFDLPQCELGERCEAPRDDAHEQEGEYNEQTDIKAKKVNQFMKAYLA